MNPRRTTAGLLLAAVSGLLPLPAFAVMLAPPFTDHAVLQRDVPVPVWGRAGPGETVVVRYRGQKRHATAGPDGHWSLQLAPMAAATQGADLIVAGTDTLTLHDVVVGEVWLASGQSNMEWPLRDSVGYAKETARPANPLLRHLRIEHSPSDRPTDAVQTGGWQPATPESIGGFSGVGYFFARYLVEKLQVPVGIIHSSWGGTPIESWLAEPALRATRAWPGFNATWQAALQVFPQKMAEYPALDAAWHQADEAARAGGPPNLLPWPHPPVGPGTAYAPGALFNGMIAPLVPYALRGVLWYQAESNVERPDEYRELIQAMIRDWRAHWPQGDFPFYFVQLPNYADGDPAGSNWAVLREAQTAALALPNTGMAVAIDVGEPNNIHPHNKRPVGERLALMAGSNLYQLPGEWSGPVVASVQREGAALRVRFTHAAGLNLHAGASTGFAVSGADGAYRPAIVRLEGESALVSSAAVPEPRTVRYAWANSPPAPLYNAAGLPAAPFRTDK